MSGQRDPCRALNARVDELEAAAKQLAGDGTAAAGAADVRAAERARLVQERSAPEMGRDRAEGLGRRPQPPPGDVPDEPVLGV